VVFLLNDVDNAQKRILFTFLSLFPVVSFFSCLQ